jgi:DNA-binding response OmpR family regulator
MRVSGGRVLIVDDDPRVGLLVREFLDNSGFDCTWVGNDRWAYDKLRNAAPFDALVLDINLGEGVTGFDLARFARQVSATTAVLYVSGEANAASWSAFAVPGSRFLSKPLDLEMLAATLAALIVGSRLSEAGGGSGFGAASN